MQSKSLSLKYHVVILALKNPLGRSSNEDSLSQYFPPVLTHHCLLSSETDKVDDFLLRATLER